MTKEALDKIIIDSLSKEYQSIWLIDVSDHSMIFYRSNEGLCSEDVVPTVKNLDNYEKACNWYIDNFVIENDRDRLRLMAHLDRVMEEIESGEQYFIEYNRVRNEVINYNQLVFDQVLEDGVVKYIFLGFRDVDFRKKAEIDDITGLLTRQRFVQKAEELIKDNPDAQIDIIISDIVDFKKINDAYGVKVADRILKWMGGYLSPLMNDELVIGRYSGDQMVMLGTHEALSKVFTDESRKKFIEAERTNGLPTILTKFGAYENVSHDSSVISNCDKAHIALNSIKRQYGIEMAFYDDSLKGEIDKQRRIEESMYESLKNGDFKVYYQPKHDALTGELVGAEALIRWIHPEYGFMSPADFIPLFEQNGFIVENDRFVWRKTCENLNRWQKKGIKTVPVSINFSKLTMKNIDLLKDMQMAVNSNDISPRQLHVEVTETLMMDDIDELVRKLTYIRTMGYEIELDDFGAGFSSMNVLSTLPLDVVKLDMSFMQQFGDEKRSKVLAACINLAKELGFKTVSEGVEHKEQTEVLGKLGIDMIQGYYYSRPLSEEDFENYLVEKAAN